MPCCSTTAQTTPSYFATRRDKQVIFSSDRRAAITYRTVGSVPGLQRPVGDPHAWQDVIERWMLQARSYGWVPAALSVSEAGARAYSRAGLSVLQMGEEAVLETDRFTLNDTSMLAVPGRSACATRRVRRADSPLPELDEDQKRQIQHNIEAWRHGRVERGFSMALNRVNDPADQSTVLVSAHDSEGRMVALLSFVPWGPTGSLMLMRRPPRPPTGWWSSWWPPHGAGRFAWRAQGVLEFRDVWQIFAAADRVGASAWNRFASRSLGVLDRFLTAASPVSLQPEVLSALGTPLPCLRADAGACERCGCGGRGGGLPAGSVRPTLAGGASHAERG